MSVGPRLRHEDAHKVAKRLMSHWGMDPAYCLIAGSIRRSEPEVGDIDLVAPMPQSRSLGRLLPDVLHDRIAETVAPADAEVIKTTAKSRRHAVVSLLWHLTKTQRLVCQGPPGEQRLYAAASRNHPGDAA